MLITLIYVIDPILIFCKMLLKILPLKVLLTMTDFESESLLPEIAISFADFHFPEKIMDY